ncbi:DUF4145 domain-containing protein [Aurantibacter sp.]|uniref:DUF4145 domain-containing protein n=1 Tax=Aurantibacter sp. TaxID=2807103 RepID=UPI0032649648
MKIQIDKDKTVDKKYRILCSNCTTDTNHQVLSSIYETGSEPMDQYNTFDWNSNYEIIQCLGCDTISFKSHKINSENTDYDGSPIDIVKLYPKREYGTLSIKEYWHVPHNIKQIYKETIHTYNNGNLTLSAAGIRAIVEGLCEDNNIKNGTITVKEKDGTEIKKKSSGLQGKINGLHENGKLTKENADILHEHRFLGNKALHELTIPSKMHLKLAIEIIENVFDNLYEIPKKGLELKNKRLGK